MEVCLWDQDADSLSVPCCRYVFQSEAGTPFIFTGTGTGGWESALTNTLSPGMVTQRSCMVNQHNS